MASKKELEEEIRRINLYRSDLETKMYAMEQRYIERVIKQENTINQLANILEESYGKPIHLIDDNGLRMV